MASRLTVLHVSDLQCGRPFQPEAADAVIGVAGELGPDLVVVAGDLTQRAKKSEYRLARSVLDRFGDVPVVITPGNHDVPVYRVWERVTKPFRNWRAFAGRRELDSITHVDGAMVVALASAAPHRAIVNGRVRADQVDFARRAFGEGPEDALRILVVHHHFAPVPTGEGSRPLPRAEALADAFRAMGVDVVLGGHVHQLHLRVFRGLPFLATGTATSSRGRGAEAGWNSLCVHRFEREEVEVTPWRRAPDAAAFAPMEPIRFTLGSARRAQEETAR